MKTSIFNDVIGPVMRGASSSHCAAALRIAGQNGYVNCDPWGMNASSLALLRSAVERGIEVQAARGILAQYAG